MKLETFKIKFGKIIFGEINISDQNKEYAFYTYFCLIYIYLEYYNCRISNAPFY